MTLPSRGIPARMPSSPVRLADRVRQIIREQQDAYAVHAEDERPLGGYVAAIGGFTALTLTVGALSARKGAAPMTSVRDVLLLGVATHKLARIISKDAVASRAPFTAYTGPAGPGEVMEEVRGHGVRHAVGEPGTPSRCSAR